MVQTPRTAVPTPTPDVPAPVFPHQPTEEDISNPAGPAPPSIPVERTTFGGLAQDLIFGICSHLHPRDVLTLARTTKTLREILMNKDNQSIWAHARLGIAAPDPPQDVSEPQYASFLFERGCHGPGCNEPDVKNNYVTGRRFCEVCLIACRVDISFMNRDWPAMPRSFRSCTVWDSRYPGEDKKRPGRMTYVRYRTLKERFLALPSWDKPTVSALKKDLMAEDEWKRVLGYIVHDWLIQKRRAEAKAADKLIYANRDAKLKGLFLECTSKPYTDAALEAYKKTREGSIEWFAFIHCSRSEISNLDFDRLRMRLDPAICLYVREQALRNELLAGAHARKLADPAPRLPPYSRFK